MILEADIADLLIAFLLFSSRVAGRIRPVVSSPFLCIFRVKKPKIKVEKTEITHKIQPMVVLLNIPFPTNPVKNDRDGSEESAIIRSQSSFEIFLFL